MAKLATMSIKGSSGKPYAFDLYPLNTEFKALGGVYVFSKRVAKTEGGGSHTFLYVGQTGDLSSRFTDHHKEQCMDSHAQIAFVSILILPKILASLKSPTFWVLMIGLAMARVVIHQNRILSLHHECCYPIGVDQ